MSGRVSALPFNARAWVCSAFCLIAVAKCGAQSYHGGVRGLITDAAGAAMPSARVTLKDQSTNVVRTTATNEAGEYVFSSVIPSVYTVAAEAAGFKKFERQNVAVGTQEYLTIDIRLEVGQITESIS